jgi:hypothetical protein
VILFRVFQLISFASFCTSFPTTDENFATKKNVTDPNIVAIILQNPSPAKGIRLDAVQSRKLGEIFSWLMPLFSSALQSAGGAVSNAGTAAGSLTNSIFGQQSFAYPFPFRR